MQNWLADQLEGRPRRGYTVERESHVADENEPDFRFRTRETDASVPMEIKIAESWSLTELEAALTDQLVGQYLRDRNDRWGILLLVRQGARARGWQKRGGGYFSFEEVVEHLRAMAHSIAAEHSQAPQPAVAVIDVSSAH